MFFCTFCYYFNENQPQAFEGILMSFKFVYMSFLLAGVKSVLLPLCVAVDGVNGNMRYWFVCLET